MRLPAEIEVVAVDHAATRDGGRRRHGQVLGLEEQRHLLGHGDALAVDEREYLVVVHHRVHALDPDGVDRRVEEDPLLVRPLVRATRAHHRRQDAVAPLARAQVELAVELAERHRLRVDRVLLGALVARLAVAIQARQALLQRLPRHRLARLRATDDHHRVTRVLRLEELYDLVDRVVVDLQVVGA